MQRFGVVGGILCQEQHLLLVENRRRDGRTDWSPPGGVIDSGESPLDALTREVAEETALEVSHWSESLYRVEVTFIDRDALLVVDVFAALEWSGVLHVDDPDEVVVGASFFDRTELDVPLSRAPLWVREPLLDWVSRDAEGSHPTEPPHFRYRAHKRKDGGFHVESVE